MRPKFILSVLMLAFGLLTLLLLLSKAILARPGVPADSGAGILKTVAAEETGAVSQVGQRMIPTALPSAITGIQTNPAEQVSERLAELQALAMNDDPNSLNVIFSEFANPDPQIRRGALEAVIQFGDRSAVPRLQAIAEQTENEAERVEVLSAIEFLNLPEFTDRPTAQSAKAKSSRLTNTNRPAKNPFRR